MSSLSDLGPDRAVFEHMAREALERMPARFREQLANVTLHVTEFATPEQLSSVELTDKWHLSGLYEGVPLPQQSLWDTTQMPPRIWLFRQPLLAEWEETGVELDALISHVVVHEAGHHFGFSDEEMHWLEDTAG